MSMISHQIDELRVLEDWLRTTGQPKDANTVQGAIDTIQTLSAKVREQNADRRGKWIVCDHPAKNYGGVTLWYECDQCGMPGDKTDNYCKHCGSKMKGERK